MYYCALGNDGSIALQQVAVILRHVTQPATVRSSFWKGQLSDTSNLSPIELWLFCVQITNIQATSLKWFPSTITSAIIQRTFMDLLWIGVEHCDCAQIHGLRFTRHPCSFARLICAVNSRRTEKQHAAQKGTSRATFGGHRNQSLTNTLSSRSGPDLRYILQHQYTWHGN